MQRKLLFAIVALMCSVGVWAETDYTSLMSSDWTGSTGNFGGGKERYQGANYETGKIMYQSFTAPAAGIYEIKFYAVASSTSGRGFDNISGNNIAQAYASAGSNKATVAMTVIDQTGCTLVQDANIRTLSVEAAEGETIEYGLENIATGGNWYTIKELSAKMKTVAEIFQAQYDEAYAIWEHSTENETGAKATFKTYVDAMNTALSGTLAEAQTASDNLAAALVTYESKSYPVKGSGVKYDFTSKMNMAIDAWTCVLGNGPAQYGFTGATETYGVNAAGEVMYQTITGLANGEYEIHFYAVANAANGGGTASEASSKKVYAYANDQTLDLAVIQQNSCTPSDYERTFTVMVKDGTIKYGITNNENAGNWYICKNVALYMTGAPDLSDYYDAIAGKIVTANSIKSEKMHASFASALQDAIDATEGYTDITVIGTLETLSANLTTAINNANASIAGYVALNTAISNAESYTTYKPVFTASETIYQDGITAAQTVYNNASAENCAETIAALTTAIQNSNVNDYNIYVGDYAYSYATLLDVDMRNWSTTNWGLNNSDQHWNGITDPKQPIYEQNEPWGTAEWSHSATETVTLPAGNYVMGIIARASADVNTMMTVTVGEESPISTTLTKKGDVGLGVTTEGVASFAAENTYANNNLGRGWEYRFVAFTVNNDDTNVTITVSASTNMKWNWVSLTTPLLKGTVSPNQVVLNQIGNLLTTLRGYESQIHASTFDTFSTDIANAEAATTETANLTDIVTALQSDIATASAMVTNMTTIATNKGDITSLINGTFDSNTDGWTGGNHVTGLARSWRSSSINNSFYERTTAGSMTCTLSNMPAGTYKVVAAWRSIAGGTMTPAIAGTNGTTMTGVGDAQAAETEINLNGVQMPYSDLGGFTTNNSGHNWQWITATGSLANDGDLVLSFTTGGTDGWNAIDDVHLYCTSLDETNYTRTVGDGKGTINTSNSVVTADIIMENPNTILRSTGKVTTAAGEMNNNQYNSSRITKLVLYDGYDFTNSGDNFGLDNGATLYRTIPANTWCTLVVPFYPDNLDTKLVPSTLSQEGELTFSEAPASDINDTPMLVKSAEGVTAITGSRNSTTGITKGNMTSGTGVNMNGTYASIEAVDAGNYVVARVGDADALYKVNSRVSLAPFRAYFSVPDASGVKANVIRLNFDETITGISTINNGQRTMDNAEIYNLTGQRVNKTQRGIYIVNGKKVFVK